MDARKATLLAAAALALVAGRASAGEADDWNGAGTAQYAAGDYAAAASSFDAAARAGGGAPAYYNKGLAEYAAGDYAGASADFHAALDADPANAGYHNGVGSAALAMGNVGTAVAEFRKASELAPADPAFARNYASAQARWKSERVGTVAIVPDGAVDAYGVPLAQRHADSQVATEENLANAPASRGGGVVLVPRSGVVVRTVTVPVGRVTEYDRTFYGERHELEHRRVETELHRIEAERRREPAAHPAAPAQTGRGGEPVLHPAGR